MIHLRHLCLLVLAFSTALAGSTVHAALEPAEGTGNTWTAVAPMPDARMGPAAASANGKLYVFGGGACPRTWCTAVDAYDPGTNTWSSPGEMPHPIGGLLSATTGPDGRIYVCCWNAQPSDAASLPTDTIDVYDPRANTWSHEPAPPTAEDSVQLVTGLDGRIYAVGGRVNGSPVGTLSAFNLTTHNWIALTPFPAPRESFGAAVGPDGRIYVIGGNGVSSTVKPGRVDAYDPRTNAWSEVAPLPTPRGELRAVTGPDGRIYAIGGGAESRCFTSPCDVVEAYDVRTRMWTRVAPLPQPRWLFAAPVGPDGRIYVLGGSDAVGSGDPMKAVDAYTVVPADQPLPKPAPGPTSATKTLAPMPTGRQNLGAVTGADERIYAIGGIAVLSPRLIQPGQVPSRPKTLRTVEAYNPKTNTWATEPSLPAPRQGMGVARGPDGRIYVLGGAPALWDDAGADLGGLRSVLIYDPRTRHWSTGKPMPDGRYGMAAVAGRDGRIYTVGGATHCYPSEPCAGTRVVRSFNPRTGAWKTLAPLSIGRVLPAATQGRDGRIYVFGGDLMTGQPDPRFEIYDPRTNRWSRGPAAPHLRTGGIAAATAGNGHIDVIGGCLVRDVHQGGYSSTCGPPSPVDAYDPGAHRWTTLGMTLNFTVGSTAVTGADGRVYVVGGTGDGNGRLLEVITVPPAGKAHHDAAPGSRRDQLTSG